MPKLALGNHTRFGNVRTRSKTRRVLLRVGYFFTLLAAALIYTRVFPDQQQKATAHDFRRLATNADFDFDKDDCTNKTIQDKYKTEDPCVEKLASEFDQDTPGLAIAVYIAGILYVFLGIAVVCDDHFCVSLEVICDILDLDEAVAGATFMAAGSSAPELATSLVTVFTSKDGTGLGTILGSAVFNLVMIVCLSGMFGQGPEHKLRFDKDGKEYLSSEACAGLRNIMVAKESKDGKTDGKTRYVNPGLFLDWRPLFRDATFYIISLIICVIFALTDVGDGWCDNCEKDGKLIDTSEWCVAGPSGEERKCAGYNNMPGFNWMEGGILTLCYGFYIHSMIKNEELMSWLAGPPKSDSDPCPVRMKPHIQGFIDAKELAAEREENLNFEQDDSVAKDDPDDGDHETTGLLDSIGPHPDGEPSVPRSVAPAQGAVPAEASVSVETQGEAKDIESLRKRIDALEDKVYNSRQMKQLFDTISDTKFMYKVYEEEEEEGLMNKIVGLASLPWDLAFTWSIPPCDRDSYQIWNEEPKYAFSDIPKESQDLIARERAMKGLDDEGEEVDPSMLFIRGKYKRKKVLVWYNRSKVYLLSFIMSIVWIGITSFLMVFFAQFLGCHLNIGPFLMGLLFLAAGTSIPDALSSVVVAQEGDGDMAVANAIGSNVFNIFLGIGLPMMFNELTVNKYGFAQPYLVTDTIAVVVTSVMLIVITIIMYFSLVCSNWILSKGLSAGLMIFFFIYIGFGTLFDAGVIGLYSKICSDVHPSMFSCEGNCPGYKFLQTCHGVEVGAGQTAAQALCNWATPS